MVVTKIKAEETLQTLKDIITNNPHYAYVSKAYVHYINRAILNLDKRITRGDFDEVSQ